MSLQTRLEALAAAIGADIKSDRASMGALASLTTSAKASLVAAINEVNAKPSGGGGGSSLKSVEIDFGVLGKLSYVLTISDASFVVGQKIIVEQSGDAATGRQADENELEAFRTNATITAAGSARVNVHALPGTLLQGKFRLNYTAG